MLHDRLHDDVSRLSSFVTQSPFQIFVIVHEYVADSGVSVTQA